MKIWGWATRARNTTKNSLSHGCSKIGDEKANNKLFLRKANDFNAKPLKTKGKPNISIEKPNFLKENQWFQCKAFKNQQKTKHFDRKN